MRFMIIVKATRDSEAGVMLEERLEADMATCHEDLQKAGMLIDASGLPEEVRQAMQKMAGCTEERAT